MRLPQDFWTENTPTHCSTKRTVHDFDNDAFKTHRRRSLRLASPSRSAIIFIDVMESSTRFMVWLLCGWIEVWHGQFDDGWSHWTLPLHLGDSQGADLVYMNPAYRLEAIWRFPMLLSLLTQRSSVAVSRITGFAPKPHATLSSHP